MLATGTIMGGGGYSSMDKKHRDEIALAFTLGLFFASVLISRSPEMPRWTFPIGSFALVAMAYFFYSENK